VMEGISTHYANIEDTLDHQYAETQISRFEAALAAAELVVEGSPLSIARARRRRFSSSPRISPCSALA